MPSLSYIPQMSMTSIFDILVVAFLVYEFLKLVKGTRAIPMLVAVVILGAAFWIAHFEALKTVDWLITTLLPYAIFALIVVFGAENHNQGKDGVGQQRGNEPVHCLQRFEVRNPKGRSQNHHGHQHRNRARALYKLEELVNQKRHHQNIEDRSHRHLRNVAEAWHFGGFLSRPESALSVFILMQSYRK